MGISIAETAKILGVNQIEVYKQLKNGQLKTQKINGRILITQSTLLEYQARKKRQIASLNNNP